MVGELATVDAISGANAARSDLAVDYQKAAEWSTLRCIGTRVPADKSCVIFL